MFVDLYECRECKRPIRVSSQHVTVDCHGIPARYAGRVTNRKAARLVEKWRKRNETEAK